MKDKLARIGWGLLAALFLITGLGVGIIYFLQATHQSNDQSQTQNANQLQGKPMAGFTPVAHVDKLEKIDQKVGTGTEAKSNSSVTVDYIGAVAATGIVFQSSLDAGQPASFALDQVIKGWAEGIPGMKVGGIRRLLIPASLAYGANPPPGSGIPANADLVFDVTLLNVK